MKSIEKMSDHEIAQYLREDRKKCVAVWAIEDVIDRAQGKGFDFNEDSAHRVIEDMDNHHDCNYGISWETMDEYIHQEIDDNCYDVEVVEEGSAIVQEVKICSLKNNENVEDYYRDDEIYYYGLPKEEALGYNNGEFKVLRII